mmetsp:Transcript_17798/g.46042  ORF Transcript_17798/g.46042 Transcript_17798/m.46042 type:complete len:318 (-) Transcript_17798:521-1474(-)
MGLLHHAARPALVHGGRAGGKRQHRRLEYDLSDDERLAGEHEILDRSDGDVRLRGRDHHRRLLPACPERRRDHHRPRAAIRGFFNSRARVLEDLVVPCGVSRDDELLDTIADRVGRVSTRARQHIRVGLLEQPGRHGCLMLLERPLGAVHAHQRVPHRDNVLAREAGVVDVVDERRDHDGKAVVSREVLLDGWLLGYHEGRLQRVDRLLEAGERVRVHELLRARDEGDEPAVMRVHASEHARAVEDAVHDDAQRLDGERVRVEVPAHVHPIVLRRLALKVVAAVHIIVVLDGRVCDRELRVVWHVDVDLQVYDERAD